MIQQAKPTPNRVREAVETLIERNNRRGDINLRLPEDGLYEQEDWIHVILLPARPGIRATDFVERLLELESELKQNVQYDHIMLLPARGD